MTRNTKLDEHHWQLISLVDALARAQEQAQTVEAVKAIDRVISEATRVTLVGQLLSKVETARFLRVVDKVINTAKLRPGSDGGGSELEASAR